MVKAYQCDIGSDDSVAAAMQDILTNESKLDLVYNVAGIYLNDQKVGLADTDMEACMKMYNINCLGTLRVCRTLWPLLKYGTAVVNISSESGSIGGARRRGEYGYGMSKAALNLGSKLLSNELWAKNARVLVIHPGWLKTKMGGEEAMQSSEAITPEESAEKITRLTADIENIPRDQIFLQYNGIILPW